jgi:hypothetical protein
MTEEEWLSLKRPGNLVRFVGRKNRSRKLTLLMAAQLGPLLATPRLQSFCQLVKDRIDQEETSQAPTFVMLPQCPHEVGTYNGPPDSRLAYLGYCSVIRPFCGRPSYKVAISVLTGLRRFFARSSAKRDLDPHFELEQAELVRDIFGNPFRPVAFDPRWRTEDTVGLARGIYEDRAFDRLPLLADALMDAGCADEQVLSHCKSEGPHVRGCWVVDLVLDKE